MELYKLFNIDTEEKWITNLMPSLKCLITFAYLPGIHTLERGELLNINFDEKKIVIRNSLGHPTTQEYDDIILLDDEDRLLKQKTESLQKLYQELFN